MCPPTSDYTASTAPTSLKEIPSWVPSDPISQSSYRYAQQHLHPDILSHSSRVYLYAHSLATREASPWAEPSSKLPLLFTAALFHDIGTSAAHDGETYRFEIEGGDAAVAHLRQFIGAGSSSNSISVSEQDVHSVWIAIALHTSPQVAERIEPLARILRLAVTLDFKRPAALSFFSNPEEIERVEKLLPRGEIEKVLGDAVVEQAVRRPEKAPMVSWPGTMYRSHLENPKWDGVNLEF